MVKTRTEAQLLASRLNGQKSRGPQTAHGKSVSSQNAVKHGLTSRRVVLWCEKKDEYDGLLEGLTEQFGPKSAYELQLVTDIAQARWRLNRLLDIETAAIDLSMDEDLAEFEAKYGDSEEITRTALAWINLSTNVRALPELHRHEVRLRRIIERSTAQLLALAAARPFLPEADFQNEPEADIAEPETDILQNEPEPEPQKIAPVRSTRNRILVLPRVKPEIADEVPFELPDILKPGYWDDAAYPDIDSEAA